MSVSVLYYDSGVLTRLDGMVTDVSISGDTAKDCRTCEISLNNTENGRTKKLQVKLGREVRALENDNELFRGILFKSGINKDGQQSFTSYDYNVYLSKNSDHLKFVKKKASDVIKAICTKFGIKTGRIDDTKYVIPKLIFEGKTLYEMIVVALTETRKQTGKRYFIRNVKGALELHEVKVQTKVLHIEAGRNLLSANFSEDIEERKTQVKLTGGDKSKPVEYVAKDTGAARDYGIMQHYEHKDDVTQASKLKPLADALLKELNKTKQEFDVEALGDSEMVSGVLIKVTEPMTGLSGAFYIAADTHKFSAEGVHTMTLKLVRELELPEQSYQAPEESQPKAQTKDDVRISGGTTGGSNGSSGSVPAVVSLANSYKGKLRYVFGGKNPASGGADCSGFTQYVFKKARGINIGAGTSAQVSQGTRINKSEARAGDLVFFQGTYRAGVSHVGIVTRPGYFVHLASSGCMESSYTSGYWGNHYMQIRRV